MKKLAKVPETQRFSAAERAWLAEAAARHVPLSDQQAALVRRVLTPTPATERRGAA